jgi:hypothetical protein
MANVTYYLGAGASANALPTYENFAERFRHFAAKFSEPYVYTTLSAEDIALKSDLFKKCLQLSDELEYHNTPDTLAKKLFHKNDYELVELKKILILFFIEQQMFGMTRFENEKREIKRHEIDKRYDTLLASILKPIQGDIKLNENFNVITWNYDLQFELALSRYFEKDVYEVSQIVNVFPDISRRRSPELVGFNIVHLNGVSYCEADGINHPFKKVENEEAGIKRLLKMFQNLNKGRASEFNFSNLIEFAWEKYKPDFSIDENENLKAAIRIATETEVLVIIGYSFPIFNSAIDSHIFSSMKKLKKVYLQTKDTQLINQLDNSDLHKVFKAKERVIDLGFTNQFHVPIEWNKQLGPNYPRQEYVSV